MRKFAKTLVRKGKRFFGKHGTKMLVIGCATGTVGAVVEAVRVTPKAMEALEVAKEEKGEELTVIEKVKTAGKYYIPCGLMAGASIGCAVAGEMTHKKSEAALVATLTTTKQVYDEYRRATMELDDGETHQKVINKIAEKHIMENPVKDADIYGKYSEGMYKFRDALTGQYFWSTVERVRKAVENLNFEMQTNGDGQVDYNTFLSYAGGDRCKVADDLGWSLDVTGPIDDIVFGSCIDQEGRPCYEIEFGYHGGPVTDFSLPFH